jgi:hypothetical protein
MGMQMGLPMSNGSSRACKRKFRWMFNIPDVCGNPDAGTGGAGVSALPPQRSERPSITFREMSAQHLNETISYPAKPEWKPVVLVLYDVLTSGEHPVFKWLRQAYDPRYGDWYPATQREFIKLATLNMLDGCGNIVEKWVWENAWPLSLEFGELDMGNHELAVCSLTLRYSRAYVTS